jgi:hypothetical protein
VLTRVEKEVAAFIAGRKAVRDVSLRVKVTQSWHRPRHGRCMARRAGGDVRRVRRRAVGWAARCGYGSTAAHGCEARGTKEEGRMAVPRRMDRRAEAGLGVRPSEVVARVARDAGATACALDTRAKTI